MRFEGCHSAEIFFENSEGGPYSHTRFMLNKILAE